MEKRHLLRVVHFDSMLSCVFAMYLKTPIGIIVSIAGGSDEVFEFASNELKVRGGTSKSSHVRSHSLRRNVPP